MNFFTDVVVNSKWDTLHRLSLNHQSPINLIHEAEREFLRWYLTENTYAKLLKTPVIKSFFGVTHFCTSSQNQQKQKEQHLLLLIKIRFRLYLWIKKNNYGNRDKNNKYVRTDTSRINLSSRLLRF